MNKISLTEWVVFNSEWIETRPHLETFGQAFLNRFFPELSHPVANEQDHNAAVFTCLREFVDQHKSIAHLQENVCQNDTDTLKKNIANATFVTD